MGFTIRHELKSSAAILSWDQFPGVKGKEISVSFLLVAVGESSHVTTESYSRGVIQESEKPRGWMHFRLGRISSVPQAYIVYKCKYEACMFMNVCTLFLCNKSLSSATLLSTARAA